MSRGFNRRRWLAAAGALAAGTAWPAAPRPGNKWLLPAFSFNGARLMRRVDAGGSPLPQDVGDWLPLIFPVAVAATPLDVYVADAGSGQLLRYDRGFDAVAVMPNVRVTPTARIRAGADGSVYVLDDAMPGIRRFTRGGAALPALLPQRVGGRYLDFVVDRVSGRTYAVDSAYLSIDEIQPLGNIAIEFQRVDDPGPLASDGRSLYVAGGRCACVTRFINGRAVQRLGAGKLRMARALVHEGGELWAIDRAERGVALVHEEGVDFMSPASLGLLQAEGLAGAQGQLWVADPAARRVAAFNINPRRSRR